MLLWSQWGTWLVLGGMALFLLSLWVDVTPFVRWLERRYEAPRALPQKKKKREVLAHYETYIEGKAEKSALPNTVRLGIIAPSSERLGDVFMRLPLKPCQHSGIKMPDHFYFPCFQCGTLRRTTHWYYVHMCKDCGNLNWKNLMIIREGGRTKQMQDIIAVVIGGRIKLGFQVALAMLRAGARVIVTTRNSLAAHTNYLREHDCDEWKHNLYITELDLGLDEYGGGSTNALLHGIDTFEETVDLQLKAWNVDHIDVLFNVAAQTIRGIDKVVPKDPKAVTRYGDSKFFPEDQKNSWNTSFEEVDPLELQEVMCTNAIAPFLLCQKLLPFLQRSSYKRRCIINVHAREGLFRVNNKSSSHPHTNMAKAALHMMTLMLNRHNYGTDLFVPAWGIDPSFFSVNEYSMKSSPYKEAPLSELEAMARVLFVLFSKKDYFKIHTKFTVRHFFKDIKV
jgi:NAD(P)-dependent dehydrogenase (short-subunit alcohol dehydrogenase family)